MSINPDDLRRRLLIDIAALRILIREDPSAGDGVVDAIRAELIGIARARSLSEQALED